MGALEELGAQECHRRLADNYIGRLAITDGEQPLIFPMNYCWRDDTVYLRTTEGTKSALLADEPLVAFEIDGTDDVYHQGWSVVVTGRARLVEDAKRCRELDQMPFRPWISSGRGGRWVAIDAHRVSGRVVS